MSDRHVLVLMDRWPSGAQARPQRSDPDARRAHSRRVRARIGDALIAAGSRLSPSRLPEPHSPAAGGVIAARFRSPG